jgi:[ribosomal protein S5]-alanine N-acetyltransferase
MLKSPSCRPPLAVSCHGREFPGRAVRDFVDRDRIAFVRYQNDLRYRELYDLTKDHFEQASETFSSFLQWQIETPRRNFQLAIIDPADGTLLGSAGIRGVSHGRGEAGIELAPAHWGRYRLALDVIDAVLCFGFGRLELDAIFGWTASGNRRVERLVARFGATVGTRRAGPAWMRRRGWQEVEWVIRHDAWEKRDHLH